MRHLVSLWLGMAVLVGVPAVLRAADGQRGESKAPPPKHERRSAPDEGARPGGPPETGRSEFGQVGIQLTPVNTRGSMPAWQKTTPVT
jgi:hypothetical protein